MPRIPYWLVSGPLFTVHICAKLGSLSIFLYWCYVSPIEMCISQRSILQIRLSFFLGQNFQTLEACQCKQEKICFHVWELCVAFPKYPAKYMLDISKGLVDYANCRYWRTRLQECKRGGSKAECRCISTLIKMPSQQSCIKFSTEDKRIIWRNDRFLCLWYH